MKGLAALECGMLTRRMILEKSPALACSKVPVPLRVRNIRLMYHGTAMVTSGSVHDTRACPSKCWGEGMAAGVEIYTGDEHSDSYTKNTGDEHSDSNRTQTVTEHRQLQNTDSYRTQTVTEQR